MDYLNAVCKERIHKGMEDLEIQLRSQYFVTLWRNLANKKK